MPTFLHSRREFVKRTGAVAATGVAAPMALNLAAVGRLAAAQATDYKALVCVFLYGGNDQYNTVVPYDAANHARYVAHRPSLATARDALHATALGTPSGAVLPDGVRYALAPQLTRLHGLWDAGELAVALNAGPLAAPLTKSDYASGRVPLPPQIFSHSDQQRLWQSIASGDVATRSGDAGAGPAAGWGGRMLELFADAHGDDAFSAVSVRGESVLLSGGGGTQYRLSAAGSVGLNARRWSVYDAPHLSTAMETLMTASHEHLLRAPLGPTVARALDANERLSEALASVEANAGGARDPATALPKDELGAQLGMVARLLAARDALGMKRQTFFVGLGGFDHHDGLATGHPAKLAALDAALSAFHRVTRQLGVAEQVTTFTASEFGRTLSSNGDGTDHGWGGHQFVLGGAVRGGRFVGKAPALADDGPDDVGRGRLLPTISVDQLGATLGRWFGASDGELADVFPLLPGFDTADLGFMRAA